MKGSYVGCLASEEGIVLYTSGSCASWFAYGGESNKMRPGETRADMDRRSSAGLALMRAGGEVVDQLEFAPDADFDGEGLKRLIRGAAAISMPRACSVRVPFRANQHVEEYSKMLYAQRKEFTSIRCERLRNATTVISVLSMRVTRQRSCASVLPISVAMTTMYARRIYAGRESAILSPGTPAWIVLRALATHAIPKKAASSSLDLVIRPSPKPASVSLSQPIFQRQSRPKPFRNPAIAQRSGKAISDVQELSAVLSHSKTERGARR